MVQIIPPLFKAQLPFFLQGRKVRFQIGLKSTLNKNIYYTHLAQNRRAKKYILIMTLTSAAQPDEDPSAILFSSCGLTTGPVNEVQLVAVKHHSSHTALPVIAPPASNILDTTVAS